MLVLCLLQGLRGVLCKYLLKDALTILKYKEPKRRGSRGLGPSSPLPLPDSPHLSLLFSAFSLLHKIMFLFLPPKLLYFSVSLCLFLVLSLCVLFYLLTLSQYVTQKPHKQSQYQKIFRKKTSITMQGESRGRNQIPEKSFWSNKSLSDSNQPGPPNGETEVFFSCSKGVSNGPQSSPAPTVLFPLTIAVKCASSCHFSTRPGAFSLQ